MPNLYVTPTEIKNGLPDGIRATSTSYDSILLALAERISRLVDNYCQRVFYPRLATRYFNGSGTDELWIPDLLEITSISYSDDDGETYTALTSSDYYATVAGDFNSEQSYTLLVVNKNSDEISVWPSGQRSIEIVGVWAFADDRDLAWENSQDEVEDATGIDASATAITVADADGANLWGITPRFQVGQILKIESEFLESTAVDTGGNTLTVVRGRNGSTAASHAKDTDIFIWRAPDPVKQATIIQAARQMERGLQGFGDARATPEIGQMMWIKRFDPEAEALLMTYRKREFA